MTYYPIDEYNPNENTFRECVAVWDTSDMCAYSEWMKEILKHGGEWEAPDGNIYSIHVPEEEKR